MKSRTKKWFIIGGIVIILVIITGVWAMSRSGQAQSFLTAEVTLGTILQTVDVTGEIESVDDLSFDATGTVNAVFFAVGEEVHADDVLATLEENELYADVISAQESVIAAQGNLAQMLAGATQESIAVSEASLAAATAIYNAAEIAYENAVASQEQVTFVQTVNVASANADLVQAEANQAFDVGSAKADFVLAMRSGAIAAHSAVSEADEVLGINNRMANDDFQDVLSALDSVALVNATSAYRAAKSSLADAEENVFTLSFDAEDDDLDTSFTDVQETLQDASVLLLYTRAVLDATAIDTQNFSMDDLSALKTTIDSERTNIQTQQAALENSSQTYNDTVLSSDQIVEAATLALRLAQATQISELVSALANVKSAEATLASRQADVVSAEASLTEVKAPPRSVDLQALQASVSQAQAALTASEARLSRTQLVSPINGILTKFDLRAGEQAVSAQAIATVQSVGENYQVRVDVPEADIAKVRLQDSVIITFDALGNDVEIDGVVQKIDPAQHVVEGVTFYQVTVFLNPSEDSIGLKPGMSADLIILTEEKNNVLSLPQRSVLEYEDGSKYVRIPEGSENYREVIVTTGLRADGGQVEILSGVVEGETVIVSIRN